MKMKTIPLDVEEPLSVSNEKAKIPSTPENNTPSFLDQNDKTVIHVPSMGINTSEFIQAIETAKTKTELIDMILNQLTHLFLRSLILLKQKEGYVIWKMDKNFFDSTLPGFFIPLTSPSVVKIVQESKRPYFGKTVNTEANQLFFEKIQKPNARNIMLLPCNFKNTPIAMLYGEFNPEHTTNYNLAKCEEVATSFTKKFVELFF